MAHLSTDIQDIYKTYFGGNFKIPAENYAERYADHKFRTSRHGSKIVEEIGGRDVFLPVRLAEQGGQSITLRCCTLRAVSKKTIVRTAVPERGGTVKEEFSVGDWEFTLKGVLIGDNRAFPDYKMMVMREIYESKEPIYLYSAFTDIFLPKTPEIAIESLEFPEVEGGCAHHRPFVMTCESDNIRDLIIPM